MFLLTKKGETIWQKHILLVFTAKLKIYGEGAGPAMNANGAKPLARGSNISRLEGIPPERAVILEFESVEAVQKAYQSQEYQAAKEKFEGGVDRVLFVIEGV